MRKKYKGYLARQSQIISKFKKAETKEIPSDFSYDQVPGLLNEARQKLKSVRPRTLGQAYRIPGITPSCIGILSVYLERHRRSQKESVFDPA